MKKSFYIENLHHAALMEIWSFKTAYADIYQGRREKATEQNEKAFAAAFQALQNGKISVFYTQETSTNKRSGNRYTTTTAYHRSPRKPGYIQESHFYTVNGNPEIIALSDQQHKTAQDAIKHGYKSGCYIIKQ